MRARPSTTRRLAALIWLAAWSGAILLAPQRLAATSERGAASDSAIHALMQRVNNKLSKAGTRIRLREAAVHSVGLSGKIIEMAGVGSAWPNAQITYSMDTARFPPGIDPEAVQLAFVRSFESWNEVAEGHLVADGIEHDGTNHHLLDFIGRDASGQCVDIVDPGADPTILLDYDRASGGFDIAPRADVFIGGWLSAEYFSECLDNADLLAITWTFSGPDANGDSHPDRLYVEQYFNAGYRWGLRGSRAGRLDAPIDIESIALHESGHAHGVGHVGQATTATIDEALALEARSPGASFNPMAVMNPLYLGGEKRWLTRGDVRAFRKLYPVR